MFCTKCDGENPAGASFCAFCGAAFAVDERYPPPAETAPTESEATQRPVPRLAVASLVLGVFALLFLGVTALLGLALGIIARARINRSGGRLHGRKLALAGIACSVVALTMMPVKFAVFAHAREKARYATCRSNLLQIGLAMAMYCQDYDERFPMNENWCDALYPYTRNESIYVCPSLSVSRCAYAFNSHLGKLPLAAIKSPAETVLCFGSKGGWNVAGGPEIAVGRHAGRVMVVFVDGHVRCVDSVDSLLWRPSPGIENDDSLWVG